MPRPTRCSTTKVAGVTPSRSRLWVALLVLMGTVTHANDQIPGELENVVLVGGTVHTVTGETIENGIVLIRDGEIISVQRGGGGGPIWGTEDGQFQHIDVTGMHVYPGMIDAATTIGMTEIGAVRASRDLAEAGGGDAINPNAQARVVYNVDSELIPTIRANGVLMAHIHPTGGLVAGQSAVMQLDGWTFEDATVVPRVGMVVNWPAMLPRTAWWIDESAQEQMEERDERIATLETFFDEVERYRQAGDEAAFDIRLQAMLPVLDGTLPVLMSAEEASQIEAAVAFAKRRGLRMILVGGAEADKVSELLKANDIPVIITGVHRLPRGRDADIDGPGKLAPKLRDAGIRFAIASASGPPVSGGARWPMLSRNLPYHAAEAVAHGLTREEALAAITSSPAKILGIDDQLGSLEPGKVATLFVSNGDILDVRSNVTHAWIAGRRVDLSSKHTELRDKYRRRLDKP